MEEQRHFNVHHAERNTMDSGGQGATRHPIKIHRTETAREPRKVESSQLEKAETTGKVQIPHLKRRVFAVQKCAQNG